MTDHMDHLEAVAAADVEALREKERTYGGSWKKRGGVGAFMMLARKWDRLETILQDVVLATDGVGMKKTKGWGYDVFRAIASDPSGADGSALAEVRDLRRYLLLVEAEMVARGVVAMREPSLVAAGGGGGFVFTPPGGIIEVVESRGPALEETRTRVPVHAVGDPAPVPVEDSNRHAERARVSGQTLIIRPDGRRELVRDELNTWEWNHLLTPADQRLYEWIEHESKWKLRVV